MTRSIRLGPLDPIFDNPKQIAVLSVTNTPGYSNLTVTINQAVGQADPVDGGPVLFTVVFSEAVTGFATGDVTLTGTALPTTGTVVDSGDHIHFTVTVTGMSVDGLVTATIAAGVCTSAGGVLNSTSTSIDNTVQWNKYPFPIINVGVSQLDPVGYSPIVFDVVWSEAVTGFATGDVDLSTSTTGGSLVGTVTDSGDHINFTVSVAGMNGPGDVIASINAGVCTSTATSRINVASTSTDNSVAYTCTLSTSLLFSDDMSRPDHAQSGVDSLGACWDQLTGAGTVRWGITSSRMTRAQAGSAQITRETQPRLGFVGPDFTFEWDMVALPGVFIILYSRVRSDVTGDNCYRLLIENTGSGGPDLHFQVDKIVGGVVTLLDQTTRAGQGSGGGSSLYPFRCRFAARGSTITVETMPAGGGPLTSQLNISDTAVVTGDLVSFLGYSNANSSTIIVDNVTVTPF